MAMLGNVQVGKPAPDFKGTAVVDGHFKEVSLSSYTDAHHWLIMIFFPKAWSFICPTEILAFSARLEEFLYSRSCAVLFVSTDSDHCLKAWNSTSEMEGGLGGVHVPLFSDITRKVTKDYGVFIEEQGVSQRGLFIIDPKGIVRSIMINDSDVGRSVDEAQRVLDALMFKDEFGEGCPVDWKKGDKGIDIASETKLEGEITVGKKSWSEWARPKLTRAFSAQSARSINSAVSVNTFSDPVNVMAPEVRAPASTGNGAFGSPLRAGHMSPKAMLSPTSNKRTSQQLEGAMLQQRLENIEAAMRNQSLGVGVAN